MSKKLTIEEVLELTWLTKDQKKIRLREMSQLYLENCAKFCKQKAEKYWDSGASAISYSGGEMAEYYAHIQGDRLLAKADRFSWWADRFEEVLNHKKKQNETIRSN